MATYILVEPPPDLSSTSDLSSSPFPSMAQMATIMLSVLLLAFQTHACFTYEPQVSSKARIRLVYKYFYRFGLLLSTYEGQYFNRTLWHSSVFFWGEIALGLSELVVCIVMEGVEHASVFGGSRVDTLSIGRNSLSSGGGHAGDSRESVKKDANKYGVRRIDASFHLLFLSLLLMINLEILNVWARYLFFWYPSPFTPQWIVREWKLGSWLLSGGWYAMFSYDLLAVILTNGLAMTGVVHFVTEKEDNDDVNGDKKNTCFFAEQGSREALYQNTKDFVCTSVACLNLIQCLHAWTLKSFLFREGMWSLMSLYHVAQLYRVCSEIWRARALERNVDAQFSDASPEEFRRMNKDVCAICLKGMQPGCSDRVKRHPCQHSLHRNCLLQVVKGGLGGTEGVVPSAPVQPRCPLCREFLFENEQKKKDKTNEQQQSPSMAEMAIACASSVVNPPPRAYTRSTPRTTSGSRDAYVIPPPFLPSPPHPPPPSPSLHARRMPTIYSSRKTAAAWRTD